uniref:Uncharacterized protein n=1 Tax=Theileria annulata TaxID=5874 RepID=A0A3B0MJP0_THEAN
MKKRVPDAGDFLESYFLGLSCLVCSEQFYILISQTKASPNFQWYLLIFTSFVTLTLVLIFYKGNNDDLITLVHYYYLYFLALLVCFVLVKITSVLVTTCTTIGIGLLTTFLIIEACVHYSSNAKLVLAFLTGLLSARILPSFCWILTAKEDYESQSMSVSLILSIGRCSFCLLSLCIKFMKGDLSLAKVKSMKINIDEFSMESVKDSFEELYKFNPKIITIVSFDKTKIRLKILSFFKKILPIFCFYFCIIFFLPLSPVMDAHLNRKSSFIYAPHVIRSLSTLEIGSHLFGFCIAILFPASINYNLGFYSINMFNISVRFFIQGCFSFFLKIFSNIGIYLMIIIISALNGYVCSYDLFVIVSGNLVQNCKNKENLKYACCGDKFLTECYCRYPAIINEKNRFFCIENKIFESENISGSDDESCSKSLCKYYSLNYSPCGTNAILLVQKDGEKDMSEIFNKVSCNGECCQKPCNYKCGCLRLCEVYEINTVTTSTCEKCQLSVRIEGTKCKESYPCFKCRGSSGGSSCQCNSGTDSNCCCICVKCCPSAPCKSPCSSCLKLCCCENCKKYVPSNGTRVFLFYKSSGVCCIMEISPNTKQEIDCDFNRENVFYINSIFMTGCCHSDIRVDLNCKLSSNFFRITPIQYPKKPNIPKAINLCKINKECHEMKKEDQCWCVNVPFKKIAVRYSTESLLCKYSCPTECTKCSCCQPCKCCCTGEENKCDGCQCCKDGCQCCKNVCQCCKCFSCCCSIGAEFSISSENSFDKRMKPEKIKLISIFWILFFLILIFTYLIMSSVKIKELNYYDFKPVTSYEIITNKTKRNDLNSPDDVKRRIDAFLMNSGLESKEYDNQLEHMLKLFECTLDPNNFTFLRNHVEEVSLKLLNNPVFILKAKIEMVKWSCCLGLIYTYVMEMFIRIQNFFVNWEYVWEKEYKYYRMKMANRINQITYESKFGVAGLSEYAIGLKAYMSISKTRKDTWSSALYNLENYLNLYEGEIEFKEKQFPESSNERLQHYIDMWNNRIDHLEDWIDTETILFDWAIFLEDFPSIKTWVNMFGKYVQGAFDEVVFDEKKFNKGTKIFLIDKIK